MTGTDMSNGKSSSTPARITLPVAVAIQPSPFRIDPDCVPMRDEDGFVLDLDGNRTDPCQRPYMLGRIDRFACFDYGVLPNGQIALHVMASDARGNPLAHLAYRIVDAGEALATAERLWEMAWVWAYGSQVQWPHGQAREDMFLRHLKEALEVYGLRHLRRRKLPAAPAYRLSGGASGSPAALPPADGQRADWER